MKQHKQGQYIYGFHAVKSLLENQHAREVAKIYLLQDAENARRCEIQALAKEGNIECEFLPRAALDKLVLFAKHQGVVALCDISRNDGIDFEEKSANTVTDVDDLLEQFGKETFLLILDGVQDPRNLGACIRTANAAGVHGVMVPRDNAVGLTEVVHKVASGATATTPLLQVTNLARTLLQLKESGVWIYGATLEEGAPSIFEVEFQRPLAIVLGAEGGGLRRLTRESCDFLFTIPMFGSVQSLNVAVATGICLFEVVRWCALTRTPGA